MQTFYFIFGRRSFFVWNVTPPVDDLFSFFFCRAFVRKQQLTNAAALFSVDLAWIDTSAKGWSLVRSSPCWRHSARDNNTTSSTIPRTKTPSPGLDIEDNNKWSFPVWHLMSPSFILTELLPSSVILLINCLFVVWERKGLFFFSWLMKSVSVRWRRRVRTGRLFVHSGLRVVVGQKTGEKSLEASGKWAGRWRAKATPVTVSRGGQCRRTFFSLLLKDSRSCSLADSRSSAGDKRLAN